MKKAIMYGAGNIGRGFIGKVFSESGYDVCFVDVVKDIVDKLNSDRFYPVKIIDNHGQTEVTVNNVWAVNGLNVELIAQEIVSADIMATAVGVNILPKIVGPICEGLKRRFRQNGKPLNIIICENLLDADKYLRELIEEEMGPEYKNELDKKLGLVEASIGRMVPVMTDAMREGNGLKVWVEPYECLPVDKDAFIGDIPKLKGLVPFSPFGFYIKRKLFIHNMGHAICAYLGWQKGYHYIYECVMDKEIRDIAKAAMTETAKALYHEYGIPFIELEAHIDDLLSRFKNKALGDTVPRVGRDPLRKLANNDRLIGAALYCEEQGIEPANVMKGVIAGFLYNNEDDELAVKMQSMINNDGVESLLTTHCGLEDGTMLFTAITKLYKHHN